MSEIGEGALASLIDGSSANVSVGSGNIQSSPGASGNNISLRSFVNTAVEITDDGDGNTEMGFFAVTPVAQPQVEAIVTAQDIATALVALGLISQAS